MNIYFSALVLAKDPPNVTMAVEKYLKTSSNELANDLSACFMCLVGLLHLIGKAQAHKLRSPSASKTCEHSFA
jgi:hypothetical protein